MFSSLRNRLTLIFIGLAVIPLVVTSAFIGLRSFGALGQEAVAAQRNKAELVSTEVQSFILQRESELDVLTTVRGLSGLDREEQRTLLNSLLSHEQTYQELALLDSSGQETVRVSRSSIFAETDLLNRSQEDYFAKPMASGEPYFSPVRYNDEISEPLLTLAIPVTDPVTGNTSAVLVADLRFKAIWNLFGTLEYTGDEDVFA